MLDCPKCLTFWSVLLIGVSGDGFTANPSCLARLVATSILCSYLAVWLELIMYAIDTLYNRIYGSIEKNAQETGGEEGREGG